MAMKRTFEELFRQLGRLHNRVTDVLLIVEDRPSRGAQTLVDLFEDPIKDVKGFLDESLKAARVAQKAVGYPLDIDRARRTLATCQARFHRVDQLFAKEVMSYERRKSVAALGRKRGGEWLAWARAVGQGIEQCQEPLDDAKKALADCWEEIAERVGMTHVSVQTIGQKIEQTGGQQVEALLQLLEEKGVLTRSEVLERAERLESSRRVTTT